MWEWKWEWKFNYYYYYFGTQFDWIMVLCNTTGYPRLCHAPAGGFAQTELLVLPVCAKIKNWKKKKLKTMEIIVRVQK